MVIVISMAFVLFISEMPSLDVTVALAESVEAGVKPGDWIEYELNWTKTPEPYSLRIKREIIEVNESVLTMMIIQEMSNGSVTNYTRTGNFIEGTGAAALIFIPPNLQRGDLVNIEGFDVVSINGTEQRTYLGTERTVLWCNFSSKGFDILVFWDKETGVALEIHTRQISIEGVTRIIDGNLWDSESADDGNEDYGLLGIGVLLLIIAIISVALLLWRRYVSSKG